MSSLLLEVRRTMHTGKIKMKGHDIDGIAVHIAAGIAALAEEVRCWCLGLCVIW